MSLCLFLQVHTAALGAADEPAKAELGFDSTPTCSEALRKTAKSSLLPFFIVGGVGVVCLGTVVGACYLVKDRQDLQFIVASLLGGTIALSMEKIGSLLRRLIAPQLELVRQELDRLAYAANAGVLNTLGIRRNAPRLLGDNVSPNLVVLSTERLNDWQRQTAGRLGWLNDTMRSWTLTVLAPLREGRIKEAADFFVADVTALSYYLHEVIEEAERMQKTASTHDQVLRSFEAYLITGLSELEKTGPGAIEAFRQAVQTSLKHYAVRYPFAVFPYLEATEIVLDSWMRKYLGPDWRIEMPRDHRT